MSAAGHLDDEPDICPLLHGPGTLLESVTAIQITRLTLDDDGHEVRAAWCSTVPPESTQADIARAHGGGTYRAQGMLTGRFVKGAFATFEIEGEPRKRGDAANTPVLETATGLAMVKGLDSVSQAVLTLCQQHTAAIREDAHRYADSLTSLVAEFVKRPEPAPAPSNEKFLLGQLDRLAREADAARGGATGTSERNLKLEVKKLELEKGDGPAAKLLDRLADLVDPAANLLAGIIAKSQGLDMAGGAAAASGPATRAALPDVGETGGGGGA